MTEIKALSDINEILQRHEEYRLNCLNLIASENYTSKVVRDFLTSDLSGRYGCYETLKPEEREYTGNRHIHELEMATHELVKDIFKAKYVDLRPIGGHMAGMATVLGLMNPGDTVIEVSLADWGHGLVGPMCQVKQFDDTINVEYMKFDNDRAVDMEKLVEMARELRPQLVVFGGSGTLFPEPVAEFKPIAEELGITVAYDASHVTGLIAGEVFPNPLEEGADVMFGSTHKSFPGPQGGFIVSNNKEVMKRIGEALAPALVTSHHIFRLPAFAASILEMKEHGKEYASQVVKNSKALAHALAEYGFNVMGSNRDYTETHLLLVNLDGIVDEAPGKILERGNILVSDDFSGSAPEIRVGTPEITRRGMKEKDMKDIATLIKRALIDKEPIEVIAKEVSVLSRKFPSIEYSL
ncbi:aminotransferase class I/II-fold pyridoxal phosphate-dependent enzyme [Anaeromicrobium sediminis]|uniref:Glycine hydroxymethyltransferase n=1 Tax=Anaeromicrobium sediminis TaxID=1478221 RepID=A0A267MI82_9FIRM|nr:aminotransferase class I/II-fold pyridoxal phosphate-dependent enzyme [Anaeromicrobium sediminis]PAB59236.1 glycine hydroxymethyltransferase [Anaeromicrobium sediminis]